MSYLFKQCLGQFMAVSLPYHPSLVHLYLPLYSISGSPLPTRVNREEQLNQFGCFVQLGIYQY